MDLVSVIFGVFGILNALLVLLLIIRAPRKVESKPGIVNFASAVGFFNMFMIYHLYFSITLTSESVVSLFFEILMLLIGVLFIIQSLTMRISKSPERLIKPFESPVRFQSRIYFTDRIKKAFGERGVILIILGIALGYHMVYLDSFFITDLPILTNIAPNLKMSDFYHRLFLIISFLITLIAYLAFKSSKRFKEFMVDKFTISQVIKYIGGFFTKPEIGQSPFEVSVQEMGKKIGEQMKKLGGKWQDSIQKMLKGKNEKSDKIN